MNVWRNISNVQFFLNFQTSCNVGLDFEVGPWYNFGDGPSTNLGLNTTTHMDLNITMKFRH